MPVFASTWMPSLDPVGPWSISACAISAVVWLAVECRYPRNERAHNWVNVLAPLILLAFVVHARVYVNSSPWWVAYDFYPTRGSAEDSVTCYIFLAVASVLAVKVIRLPARDLRLFGWIAFALAATFIACEAVPLIRDFLAGDPDIKRLSALSAALLCRVSTK